MNSSKFLKEIYEQPSAIAQTLSESHDAIIKVADQLAGRVNKVVLVGCGDAYFVSVSASHAFREIASVPAVAVEGLDFVLNSHQYLDKNTLVVGISQSGKTIQVRKALNIAKKTSSPCLAVSNSELSPIVEIADYSLLSKAGLSIAFPTKTTLSMLSLLILFTVYLGRRRGSINEDGFAEWLKDFSQLADKVGCTLELSDQIRGLADSMSPDENFTFIATGPAYPSALIGSAKLKETSSTRSSAYQLEEFAHLHAFSIRAGDPLLFITVSERDAIRAIEIANYSQKYGVKTFAIAPNRFSQPWKDNNSTCIVTPDVPPILSPIIQSVPLHLFAYHLAVAKNQDPDRPTGFDEIALHNLIYSDLLEGWFV